VFREGRVSQTEELTAFITFKNDLVLFNSTSPCQSNGDADRAYERLSSSNNDGTTTADIPLIVNCSGLTFDDDLPIGPCTEGYGVSMIQNALISYGYQIEPDGQYGQATADAVAQFQGVKGLTVTGTVDALTYGALGPLGVGTDLNGDGVVGPNETIGD
jgi:peptidoglycan hydrolase-like protein with peptidoglycan-binding domain